MVKVIVCGTRCGATTYMTNFLTRLGLDATHEKGFCFGRGRGAAKLSDCGMFEVAWRTSYQCPQDIDGITFFNLTREPLTQMRSWLRATRDNGPFDEPNTIRYHASIYGEGFEEFHRLKKPADKALYNWVFQQKSNEALSKGKQFRIETLCVEDINLLLKAADMPEITMKEFELCRSEDDPKNYANTRQDRWPISPLDWSSSFEPGERLEYAMDAARRFGYRTGDDHGY